LKKAREEVGPGEVSEEDLREMQEAGRKGTPLSSQDKVSIIEAHARGISGSAIAKKLERNHSVISRFLDKYRTTAPLARLHFDANAERLAARVIKKANVEESLEVLDRMDVLPKKQQKDTGSRTSFNLIVGMPGQVAVVQAPDQQKVIEAAIIENKDN
jgi:predicted transcriptional regulator